MRVFVCSFACISTFISSPIANAEQSTSEKPTEVISVTSLNDVLIAETVSLVGAMKDVPGRVAVMDFPSLEGEETALSLHIANKILNGLIKGGRKVLDRATLERVLNEQKLQQNALVDQATAARVGKLAGAGVIILGSYTMVADTLTITLRALSVESGQFVGVEEKDVSLTGKNQVVVAELLKKSIKKSAPTSLDSPQKEVTSPGNPTNTETTGENQETKFNAIVCKWISPGADIRILTKKLMDAGLWTLSDAKAACESRTFYRDPTGDEISYKSVGSWMLSTACMHFPDFIRNETSNFKLDAWAYPSKKDVPGAERCLPAIDGWWNRKLGGAAGAGLPKKKKG